MTKKITLFVTILLIGSWASYGQGRKLTFGVKGGMNLSNAEEKTNYSVVGDKTPKFGYQIGVMADYSISSSLYVSSGLSLSNKGTTHKDEETWIGGTNPPVTTWEKTTHQTYLQLPLMIGYNIPLSNITKIRINAGPYFAYGVAGKEIVETKTTPADAMESNKITNNTFNKNNNNYYSPYNLDRKDYGVIFGIGIQRKKFILSLNYEMGILNIYETDKTELSPSPGTYKNKNTALTIGYTF
jgi:hypothetical protein